MTGALNNLRILSLPAACWLVVLASVLCGCGADKEKARAEAKVHYEEGLARQEKEKYAHAVTSYQKCIELDPENANAHFNLGRCYKQLGKAPEAIEAYRKYVELEPKGMLTVVANQEIKEMLKEIERQ